MPDENDVEIREQVSRTDAGQRVLDDPEEAQHIDREGIEIGVSGLRRSGGLPMDQPLRQLKGHLKGQRIFEEMSRYDDIIGASLYAIELLVRGATWRTEPGGDGQKALQQAEFVEGARGDMSTTWESMVAEAISFLPFGWAWHELVYKRRTGPDPLKPGSGSRFSDGKIGWRKIPIRSQKSRERFVFDDDDGAVQAMIQRDPNTARRYVIPLRKSLLFRTGHHLGNPEGRSVLERAYVAWYMKQRLREIEAIGAERDLVGMPIYWVPPRYLKTDAAAADKAGLAAAKEMVSNLRRDEQEGVVMPLAYDANGKKVFDLTLLTSGGTRQFDTDKIVRRYDKAMAATLMASFILLGDDGGGSLALGADKSELFEHGLNTVLDEIATVFNRHAIPRLLVLNGEPLDEAPKLMHGGVERVNLKELGNFIGDLAGAGAPLFPDDDLENHLRGQGNLPAVPVDRVMPEFVRPGSEG